MIRYGFLWTHEAAAGAVEATKDRPCAIVVATTAGAAGRTTVVVAPITRRRPDDLSAAVELPDAVRAGLGLDTAVSWVRLDELNAFTWPGYDLRPIPGRAGTYAYGLLPVAIWNTVRAGVLRIIQSGRMPRPTRR